MKSGRLTNAIAYIVFTLTTFLCILPFLLLISSSLTAEDTIIREGYNFIPAKFSIYAYKFIFKSNSSIIRAYGITILVTVIGTAVSLCITSLYSYAISRKDLAFRKIFAFIVFFTLLFNGGLVPTYMIYSRVFHIQNTVFALIVPALLMNGFNVLIMRSYYQANIPYELIESSHLDGAGEWRTFIKIILPISTPIITTIGLLNGLAYWNDWYNGLIFINKVEVMSIQNVLNQILLNVQFLSQTSGIANHVTEPLPTATMRMAIAVVAVFPMLIVYPFFQKYFAKGLTIGAVKG